MMTQCWPFAGQQHHLRAFATAAFGPDTRSLLDPRNYTALTGLPGPPGHGDFGRLMGKSPAEAWALHAALTSNEFSRRFHHLSTPSGHTGMTGATNLHGPPLPPAPGSHGNSVPVPPGHPSNPSLPSSASVPNVASLTSIDPMTAAAAAAVHLSSPYSRFFSHGYPPPGNPGLPGVTSPTSAAHLNGGTAVNYSPLSNASGPNGLFNSVTVASSNSASNLPGDLSHHHSPLSSLYSSRASFPSSGEFNGTGGHHSNHGSSSSLSPSPHLAPGERGNARSTRSPNASGQSNHVNSSASNHHSHQHAPPGSVHLHSPDSSDSYSIKQERSSVISDPGNDLIHPSSSASSSPQPLDQSPSSRKHSVINSSQGKSSSNASSPSSSPVPPPVSKASSRSVKNSRVSPTGACPSASDVTTRTPTTVAATTASSTHLPVQSTIHSSHHTPLAPSSDGEVNVMSAREAAAMLAAVNLHPSMYPGFLAAAAIHGFTHPNGASPFGQSPVASASRYPLMASGLSSLQPSLMHFAATDPVAFAAAAATGATGASLTLPSSPSLASLTSVSSAQVISTATASVTGTMSNSSSNSSGNLWRPY